jgi:hypothetical protein
MIYYTVSALSYCASLYILVVPHVACEMGLNWYRSCVYVCMWTSLTDHKTPAKVGELGSILDCDYYFSQSNQINSQYSWVYQWVIFSGIKFVNRAPNGIILVCHEKLLSNFIYLHATETVCTYCVSPSVCIRYINFSFGRNITRPTSISLKINDYIFLFIKYLLRYNTPLLFVITAMEKYTQ